jgi:hypothetical protein
LHHPCTSYPLHIDEFRDRKPRAKEFWAPDENWYAVSGDVAGRREAVIPSSHTPLPALALALAAGIGIGLAAQAQQKRDGYKDTPMLPGGKWHVHDPDRPYPHKIDAGTASTPETPGRPPSDAMVLFDGKDLSSWRDDKGNPTQWKVESGAMICQPGSGYVYSKREFGDCQLHVEWATPTPPKGDSQGRGNSGVFLMGKYEIQVLDSYNNPTYADGSAGAIYGQYPPLVNASRAPGEWQSYDILWTAPRFKEDGSVETPAYVTVLHNGVVIHNHTAPLGPMMFRQLSHYIPHGPKGPIGFQDHGNPVRYRNVWVRELKGYDQPE